MYLLMRTGVDRDTCEEYRIYVREFTKLGIAYETPEPEEALQFVTLAELVKTLRNTSPSPYAAAWTIGRLVKVEAFSIEEIT